jgi:hypothetical protein
MRRRALGVLLVVGALLVPLGAAYASHQFTDVPDSHTFHNAIDWMKDNNITVGCNPPANTRYCPDDNVTRGQMAAFMKRLAENRVVDANTLDGLDSSEVQTLSQAQIDSSTSGAASNGPVEIHSVEITVPAGGILNINGSVLLNPQGAGPAVLGVWVEVDGNPVGNQTGLVYYESHALNEYKNHGYSTSQAVAAGTHTVSIVVGHSDIAGAPAAGNVFRNLNNLTVTFVPGGAAEVVGLQSDGDSVGG